MQSHTHADDEVGHTHPGRQVYPARPDGGFWEEIGPATDDPPPIPPQVLERISVLLSRPTPPYELIRWRLRLICGHIVERDAHRDYKTAESAFTLPGACAECGRDPAVIMAARALGPAAEPPAPPAPPLVDLDIKRARLAKLRAQAAQLEHELGEDVSPT